MGVAECDLTSGYQKIHDRCAIWSVFVWRFGLFLVAMVASRHFNDIEATNVHSVQLHIFSIGFKVMIDLD
jgi:hypothetical protein